MTYYLPTATAQTVERRVRTCNNLGLLLDKYPPKEAVQESKGKSEWLREVVSNNHIDTELSRHAYTRWYEMTRAQGAQHFSAMLDWRMIIGLGGETVLETDLTLHHLYGVPYIPGSALKGLTRGYVTKEEQPSEDIDQDSEEVKRIFGSQKHAGTVVFFDAMPLEGKVAFALDIMNSHYPNYYGEKKLPTNDQSPNPITFLTVTATTFVFALAPRRFENDQDVKDMEIAIAWLQTALQKYGIGSKTSAGYGYFQEPEQLEALHSSESAQVQEASPLPQSEKKAESRERIRVNIPQFRLGQDITGSVLAPTDELRQKAPSETYAFLRYQSFAINDVLIAVIAEEAQNWKPGDTRICQFVRQEERDGCTVLICQLRPRKKKKN